MPMPMVRVRHVWVVVNQWRVAVGVRVRFARGIARAVLVPVVLVVNVQVFVIESTVLVNV